ncbi:MAG: hypothetical protein Q7S21_01375 [archaeon]|nr:hypothetical protein [archaeon]
MADYSNRQVMLFAAVALIIGVLAGMFLAYNLKFGLPVAGLVPAPTLQQACYRYVGTEVKDAFCDSQANLHFYYEGDGKLLQPGWYTSNNNSDCKPCMTRS